MSHDQAESVKSLVDAKAKAAADSKSAAKSASRALEAFHREHVNHTFELTGRLEELTGLPVSDVIRWGCERLAPAVEALT